MQSTEVTYSLLRIRSTKQDAPLLAKALAIYEAATPQLEATSSNEMLYWADRYNRTYSDELFLFALLINGEVVGFSECVHFYDEAFVVLDYMSMAEAHKTVASFFQFFELIKSYFAQTSVQYSFMVAELVQDHEGSFTSSSEFWLAMMALQRFRLADAPYTQLQLGKARYETQLPSRLIFRVGEDVSTIPRATYVMVIETLLLRHYTRWYEPMLSVEGMVAYRQQAAAAVEEIRNALGDRVRLEPSEGPAFPLPSGESSVRAAPSGALATYEYGSLLAIAGVVGAGKFALGLQAAKLLVLGAAAVVARALILPLLIPDARRSLSAVGSRLTRLLKHKETVARISPEQTP